MTVYVTPLVAKMAAELGINLDKVKGTGVGGRIRKADVRVAAGLPPVASPRPSVSSSRPLALATTRGKVVDVSSFLDSHNKVRINPWARNPLLDDAKQIAPTAVRMASREGPAPTIFTSGDLPVFTASGADPTLLLNLPWQARAVAARVDQGQLAAMFEEYSDSDGWILAGMLFAEADPVQDYTLRMRQWLRGPNPNQPFAWSS